ncbi:MAG: hypothetical protein HY370_04890, partial [Proteobacteria bacterium]|nr:hypothetical protein [Pseudomonadota bacterium]
LDRMANVPDEVRRAYRKTFEKAPEMLSYEDVSRLIEQAVESHFTAEATDAYLPINELVAGTALDQNAEKQVNFRLLRSVLKNDVLEEDSFDIRGKFVRALKEMAGDKKAVTQVQLERAFVIAGGNPYPPAQQAFRDGCNHDIAVLKSTLEQIMPGIKLPSR